MNKITTRDLLEKAIKHVIQQGKPAVNSFGNCKYRTSDGLMCAVGCLITEGAYNDNIGIEGSSVEEDEVLVTLSKSVGRDIYDDEVAYLQELQHAHDSSKESANFVASFTDSLKCSVKNNYLPEYCLEFIA